VWYQLSPGNIRVPADLATLRALCREFRRDLIGNECPLRAGHGLAFAGFQFGGRAETCHQISRLCEERGIAHADETSTLVVIGSGLSAQVRRHSTRRRSACGGTPGVIYCEPIPVTISLPSEAAPYRATIEHMRDRPQTSHGIIQRGAF
jgi:hypothetical protein